MRRHAGLTLLELLPALVIFGLLFMLLGNGWQFGVLSTRLSSGEQRADLLAIDHALRRAIALADPGVFPEPATLRGTAGQLTLVTELPAGGSGPSQRADAVLFASGGRLVLRWRRHLHAEWTGAGPAWSDTVITEGVDRVVFAYRGQGAADWAGAWTRDTLPAFVRVELQFTKQDGRRWPPLIVAPVREPIER